MTTITSLRRPRPVATVPTSPAYRSQPGRLVTVAGFVRPTAVTGFRAAPQPEATRQAA